MRLDSNSFARIETPSFGGFAKVVLVHLAPTAPSFFLDLEEIKFRRSNGRIEYRYILNELNKQKVVILFEVKL
ncbi:hypothetical protein os1_02600 [Comamonadaceae bacterium OS-1]|nr:hypothetical protein os1_02600 [Comamonadaceae bacterium OS-1]